MEEVFEEELAEKAKWNIKVMMACIKKKKKNNEIKEFEKKYFQGKSVRYITDTSWNSIRSSIDENCYKVATSILGSNISLEFGTALKKLYEESSNSFRDILRLYKQSLEELSSLEEKLVDLFSPKQNSNSEYSSQCSVVGHYFVNTGTDLVCAYCGESIRKYKLTSEEYEILKQALKNQGRVLSNATKEDLPAATVIASSQLTPILKTSSFDATANFDWNNLVQDANELFESDSLDSFSVAESKKGELTRLLDIAHTTDKGLKYGSDSIIATAYFSKYKARKQIKQVNQEIREINEKSDPTWRELLLEQCRTAKYEIRILAGESINELYRKARTEDDRIAVGKAYYNLLSNYYRENSEYFNTSTDATLFSCATAGKDINKLILEMRKR